MSVLTAVPRQKSLIIAYGLWVCLGLLGAHRYYLGSKWTATVQIALMVFSVVLRHRLGLCLVLLWYLTDLIWIYFRVRDLRRTFANSGHRSGLAVGHATDYELERLGDLQRLYVSCARRGDLNSAIEIADKALTLATKSFGAEDAHVNQIISHLGEYHRQRGDVDLAISMLRTSIAAQERGLPQATPHECERLLGALNCLGQSYIAAGQRKDAEASFLRVTALLNSEKFKKATLLVSHHEVNLATVLLHQAQLYRDGGGMRKALQLIEVAVALVPRFYMAVDGLTVELYSTYASILLREGQLLQATDQYQRTLTLVTLSKELSAVERVMAQATCRSGLGQIYSQLDRLADAEHELVTALALRKGLEYPSRSDILAVLRLLGAVYVKQQAWPQAENIAKQVVHQREQLLGKDDPQTLQARQVLARVSEKVLAMQGEEHGS